MLFPLMNRSKFHTKVLIKDAHHVVPLNSALSNYLFKVSNQSLIQINLIVFRYLIRLMKLINELHMFKVKNT